MDDVYYSLVSSAMGKIKIKGSLFIGYAAQIEGNNQAESIIHEISKRYHDATHHCFAYRLGLGDEAIYRFSDGGEPSGTAGRPIHEAIVSKQLTNVVCTVTRYFGGIKLGTGGLARAYSQCAGNTLDSGKKEERFLTDKLQLTFGYESTGSVMQVVSRSGCRILGTRYGSETEMILDVRKSKTEEFMRDVNDATGGKVQLIKRNPYHGRLQKSSE